MDKEDQRISGIKAIADYLDASERSVYRWEKELGLPLHRVSGSAGSTVFVYVSELEEWLRKKDSIDKARLMPRKKRALIIVSVSVVLLAVGVSFYFVLKSQWISSLFGIPNPITSSTSGNMVFVRDNMGKDIWTFITYSESVNPLDWWRTKCIDFLDIDGDGANEVVSRVYDMSRDTFYLTLFDHDGSTLWARTIINEQTYNGLLLKSNFLPVWIQFVRQKDAPVLIVSYWRHRARFLSLIISHDLEGKLVHKYIHTGHLGSFGVFDLCNDGSNEILFAGTNNLLKGEGIVGVLKLSDFRGVCPPYRIEPEYLKFAWLKMYVPDNPVRGNQLLYLRFKRNPYFESKQHIYNFAKIQDTEENLVHIQLYPFDFNGHDQSGCFEYIFDCKFDLLHVVPDSVMLKLYPEMVKNSRTKMPLSELTESYSTSPLRWKDGDWISVALKR
jgi:hypothetical protein